MILSDVTIEKYCHDSNLITPFVKAFLQPASYDLTLFEILVPSTKQLDRSVENRSGHYSTYTLRPGEFVLGSTIERVKIPNNIVGRMEGKSSLARKGLIVHTAGFVDPGFEGQLTLEMTNLGRTSIGLITGMRISQIAFQYLDIKAKRPYGHPDLNSHYQGQTGATPSAI